MEGKPIQFAFTDMEGKKLTHKDLKGTPYVLYFYPKDDTPGCTKEACGIRDSWGTFEQAGLQVYGVSKDDAASHQRFIDKYDIPFPLLTSTIEQMQALGVWKEKTLYGRSFLGINRETFLVGADGKVLKHYKKVKPVEHAEQILADFAALS